MAYNSMSAAAEEAVRYAVAYGPNSPAPATTAQIQQIAINTASRRSLCRTAMSTSAGLPSEHLATRQDAKVIISYDYPLKIPFMSKITLHLTATSQMMASQ